MAKEKKKRGGNLAVFDFKLKTMSVLLLLFFFTFIGLVIQNMLVKQPPKAVEKLPVLEKLNKTQLSPEQLKRYRDIEKRETTYFYTK